MLSKRLLTIAKMVKKDAVVLDVGCDHAYLPIYLKKHHLCKEVYASDIAEGAVNIAKKNVAKNKLDIKVFLSDGLKNVDIDYDTLVLAGMGTHLILDILEGGKNPDNIIISSNNDLDILRKKMMQKGYKIAYEKAILDKGRYYDIIAYQKGREHLKPWVIRFGKSNNKEYYRYLFQKQKSIYKNVNLQKKIKLLIPLLELRILSI